MKQSMTTWTGAWSQMSEKTRISVSIAAGLASVFSILLGARVVPLMGSMITTAYYGFIAWLRSQELSSANLVTGFLLYMYGAVVMVGLAHVQRTSKARAQRRKKSEGKPPVGSLPCHVWHLSMVLCSVLGVVLGIVDAKTPMGLSDALFALFATTLFSGIFLGAVVLMRKDDGHEATFSSSVRIVGVVHGTLATVIGFSVENLSLLVGLWVMMYLLCPLEDNALPADYPETLDPEGVAPA